MTEGFSPESSKASPFMRIPGHRSGLQAMTLEDQYINTPVPACVGGDNCEVSILHNSSEFSCGIKLQEAAVVAGLITSPLSVASLSLYSTLVPMLPAPLK